MKSYKEILSVCAECKKGIKLQDIYYLDHVPLCKECYNQLMQDLFDGLEELEQFFSYGTQPWDY